MLSKPVRDFTIVVIMICSLAAALTVIMDGPVARWLVQAQETTYKPVQDKYKTTGPSR